MINNQGLYLGIKHETSIAFAKKVERF